jgi:hypothetical protein
VSNTIAASSSIIGAFKVGNGTAATNVAIGGGNINAGGTGTFGGAVIASGTGTIGGVFNGASSGSTNNVSIGTSGGGSLFLQGYNAAFSTGQTLGINAVAGGAVNVGNAATVTTINGTTAGSAGAGALVVTGGLSAGNNGNASYFGGKVNLATHTTSAGGIGFGTDTSLNRVSTGELSLDALSGTSSIFGFSLAGVRKSYLYWESATSTFYVGAEAAASSLIFLTANSTALTINASKAATFAGAVSITGNVGFYGQAATAKPTGVAVTAAAIHAALVTLNLIAA